MIWAVVIWAIVILAVAIQAVILLHSEIKTVQQPVSMIWAVSFFVLSSYNFKKSVDQLQFELSQYELSQFEQLYHPPSFVYLIVCFYII